MNRRLYRFLCYYKPYKRELLFDLLFALGAAVAALAFPLLVRRITGELLPGVGGGAAPQIWATMGQMVLLALLGLLFQYLYDYRGHALGAMLERDMRRDLFAHLQRLSFSFHGRQKPGALLSRVTNDLLSIAELSHHGPEDMVVSLVKFAGALAILAATYGRLTLMVVAFLPPVAVFALTVGRWQYRAMRRHMEQIGETNAQLEENLSGIREVQSHANEPLEEARFAVSNERFLRNRKGIYRAEAVFYNGIELFTQLITIAVVGFGGLAIARGGMQLADLLTFLLYVSYLTTPLTRLAFTVNQYQQGIAGFARFMEIMETPPDICDAPDAVELASCRGALALEDVGFAYDDDGRAVLSGINLSVAPGETVAIVGHSGVGKTTLCQLFPRFYDPTVGRVLLDGRDVRGITLASLRRQIGVVRQDVYLFSGTVLDNIRYGRPDATREEVAGAARKAGADGFIGEMPQGYDTLVGHRGVRLSGGQRQRIAIARAFLKNPAVLILDEATSALDTESERVVQDSLRALMKGRTTLMIAHRLSTVRSADRIVVLAGAGVAEAGTHEELMGMGGVYARLYAAKNPHDFLPEEGTGGSA